jgi:hypothetical protein
MTNKRTTIGLVLGMVLALAVSVVALVESGRVEDVQTMSASGFLMALTDGTGTTQFSVSDAGNATVGGNLAVSGSTTASGNVDLDANSLVWDADADTSSVASTDDRITTTIGAATGVFAVETGNLHIGNSVPTTALDGEDAYVEGFAEIDGILYADGGEYLNGAALTMDADDDTTLQVVNDDIISVTLGAAAGKLSVETGNLNVGDGTPDVSLDGEDAYVEGTLEVDGNTTLDGTLQYGADDLYPLGYASSGQQAVYGTASITGTATAVHGLTTVTFCLCTLGEDPTAGAGDGAMCTVAVSANVCTLKVWQDDFVTAATETSVDVHWVVIGAP